MPLTVSQAVHGAAYAYDGGERPQGATLPRGAPGVPLSEEAWGPPGDHQAEDLHIFGALLVQQVGRAHGFEGPRRRGLGPLLSEGAARLIYSAVEGRLMQLVSLALKLSRRSARVSACGVLTVADVKEAMKILNFKSVLGYDGVTCCRYLALPRPFSGSRLLRRQKARPADPLLLLQQQQQHLQQQQQQQLLQQQLQHKGQQEPQQQEDGVQVIGCGPALATVRTLPISSSSSSSNNNIGWEQCVDLEAFACGDLLLPAPRPPTLGVHWLAVEGEPPALPQNEPPPWTLLDAVAEDAGPAAAAAPGAAEGAGASRESKRGQVETAAANSTASAAEATGKSGLALRLYTKQQQQQQNEDEEEAGGELLPVEELLVAPKVNCVLGKEQQLFLASVSESLEAAMEERAGIDSARAFSKTLHVVRTISALEPLVPSLAQLFASKLPAYQHLPHRAALLLQLGEAVLQNPHTAIHAHVHQFVLPLMDCLLAPLVQPASTVSSSTPSSGSEAATAAEATQAAPGLCLALTPQQLRLRRRAAAVLGALCSRSRRQREALECIEEAAALQLLRALLHPSSSIETALGAAIGLRALGRQAVVLLLLPNAPLLLHALERGQELAETERLAISAKLVKGPLDRAASEGLLLQQQTLDLRDMLSCMLQEEILEAATEELTEQLAEARLYRTEDPQTALAQVFAVLEDAHIGLRDRYTPIVAAALRRAASAAAAAARTAAVRCGRSRKEVQEQQQQQRQQQEQQQQQQNRQKDITEFVQRIVNVLAIIKQQGLQQHQQQPLQQQALLPTCEEAKTTDCGFDMLEMIV